MLKFMMIPAAAAMLTFMSTAAPSADIYSGSGVTKVQQCTCSAQCAPHATAAKKEHKAHARHHARRHHAKHHRHGHRHRHGVFIGFF